MRKNPHIAFYRPRVGEFYRFRIIAVDSRISAALDKDGAL